MFVRIALVHSDPAFLQATERALSQAVFAVTLFSDTIVAWDGLKTGEFDVLVAEVNSPPGRPTGVTLARGGAYTNPRLRIVLMTDECEVEHAEELGELLPRTIGPDELADYLIQRFGQMEQAA
jgi:DNA-binding NtrC family response regulator